MTQRHNKPEPEPISEEYQAGFDAGKIEGHEQVIADVIELFRKSQYQHLQSAKEESDAGRYSQAAMTMERANGNEVAILSIKLMERSSEDLRPRDEAGKLK